VQLSGAQSQIADWIATREAVTQVWLIETATDLIGLLFLFSTAERDARTCQVGYLFAENAWGQGYATEAVSGLVTHLQTGPPVTLLAGVTRGNPASAHVLLKAGFQRLRADPASNLLQFRLDLSLHPTPPSQ
jgi:RimJ/RimL family protein N-acetyltransferase